MPFCRIQLGYLWCRRDWYLYYFYFT